jgi:Ubiquitin-conjugating enzyme
VFRVIRSFICIDGRSVDSIIVRAFEDRADLLRSLIIGPENTPYEDAPFVIDWMLESTFPHSPPKAHFLSWTNGNGRGSFAFLVSLSVRLTVGDPVVNPWVAVAGDILLFRDNFFV